MQNQYTQRPPTSPQGYNQPSQGQGNIQFQNQQYPYYQQHPQAQYNNPNYRQTQHYQGVPTGYHQPVNRQHAPNYPQQYTTQRVAQHYHQQGVVPAYIQPQIDYQGQRQQSPPQTSTYTASEKRQLDHHGRFRNVLAEVNTTEFDDLKRKRKWHVMDIIAPILAICILGAGFLAIYKPFNLSMPKYERQPIESTTAERPALETAYTTSPGQTSTTREDIVTDKPLITKTRYTRRRVSGTPGRSRVQAWGGGSNKILITSSPSGAMIKANGSFLGKTPYTWNNPDIYGQIELKAKKNGYGVERTMVEFTGGTVRNHFELKPSQPETEQAAPVMNTRPSPGVPTTVAQTRTPVLRGTAVRPQKVIPAANQGTIYLSTLPPNADVYLNGKKIGTSNTDLTVIPGTQTVRFEKGDMKLVKRMTFVSGKNPSQLVRLK